MSREPTDEEYCVLEREAIQSLAREEELEDRAELWSICREILDTPPPSGMPESYTAAVEEHALLTRESAA